MTIGYIRYRSDYKYQLASKYELATSIIPPGTIESDFIDLSPSGKRVVKKGYAWDGPSGLVIDTKENLRASLVHDAFYQLIRRDFLKSRTFRKAADKLFRDLCKEDGVSSVRANIYYRVLRRFGKPAVGSTSARCRSRARASCRCSLRSHCRSFR
ncbi:MAG: hypothetical protein CL908_23825 [Deltaproteobacteria bacterium]|nr:hypothetical protein [Deltaproteobacteria bacterium]